MDPTTRCPLCGNQNECGAALGKADCWCFSTSIAREVLDRVPLDRVPEVQRNVACVCRACAGATPAPDPEKS